MKNRDCLGEEDQGRSYATYLHGRKEVILWLFVNAINDEGSSEEKLTPASIDFPSMLGADLKPSMWKWQFLTLYICAQGNVLSAYIPLIQRFPNLHDLAQFKMAVLRWSIKATRDMLGCPREFVGPFLGTTVHSLGTTALICGRFQW